MHTVEDSSHNQVVSYLADSDLKDGRQLSTIIKLYTAMLVSAVDCAVELEKDLGLANALQKARVEGKYGFIVDLPAVQKLIRGKILPPHASSNINDYNTKDGEAQATLAAWRAKFEGHNHELLVECLRAMNKDRADPISHRYMNFTSIVQSSGMGKSRTVDEASKLVFTLPLNLRNEHENAYYPTPDKMVRNHFLDIPEDYIAVRTHYLRFMGHLFKIVATKVEAMKTFPRAQDLASAWRDLVYDAEQSTRQNIYATAIDNSSKDGISTEKEAITHAQANLKQLSDAIDSKCSDKPVDGELRILFYFDEAHCLTEKAVKYKGIGSQGDSGEDRTAYMALCSALSDLQNYDLMGLFLSTSSRLAKFAPPKSAFWSARGLENGDLQTPFVELPYRNPEEECLTEGGAETSLETFCSIKNLASLSRPLFKTRFRVLPAAITHFAKFKLCDGNSNAYTKESYTAVITSRVMAEFPLHQINAANIDQVRELDAKLVAAHMRIVYSIPKHREFMRTGYSSDPLLAEAAAQVMHERPKETREAFIECLTNELISKGERGEAIVRYLSILGFDKARNWGGKGFFSKPIKVLDFLKSLFGDRNFKQIKDCRAHNIVGGGDSLEVAFKDAYIYFTHFVRAEDSSVISDLCALVALSRGMAWQCYPGQADIDILFPVVFLKNGDLKETLDRTKVTFIAFQIKNRKEPKSVDISSDTLNINPGATDGRPYIAVVLELGAEPSVSPRVKARIPPTRGKTSQERPCYFFTVYGCDSEAYGVINPYGEEGNLYSALLNKDDMLNDHPRKGAFLKALRYMMPSWSAGLCKVRESVAMMDVDS